MKIVMADNFQSESLAEEAESFNKHDQEFRTITTLLHALGSHEKITLDNFQVSNRQKPYLKLLHGLSSLLVRDHETISILPKRSQHGITLFVAYEDDELDGICAPSSSAPTSASLSSSVGGAVKLLPIPIIDLSGNICDFILEHWDQTFDHHAQTFASLINNAINTPDTDSSVIVRTYSLIQSVPRTYRRLCKSESLHDLLNVNIVGHKDLDNLRPRRIPKLEQGLISEILLRDHAGVYHPGLFAFVTKPSENRPPDLLEFHQFFLWFFRNVVLELQQLSLLREEEISLGWLPQSMIADAVYNMEVLCYFSWKSDYFRDYVIAVSRIIGRTKMTSGTVGGLSGDWTVGRKSSIWQPLHQAVLDLRHITINVHQLGELLNKRQALPFTLQLIQYPKCDTSLKPFTAVIHELFPNPRQESRVLIALERLGHSTETRNMFSRDGPALRFEGQVHCEAVLASLYNLSYSSGDVKIDLEKIPKPLLRAAQNCYGFLVPSSGCCPVCSTTLSYLSDGDAPPLQVLSKHAVIFPCAFPTGLPREIRVRLLTNYRGELKTRLRALVRSGPSYSAWGEPSFISREREKSSCAVSALIAARNTMIKWRLLSLEELVLEWEAAKQDCTPAQLATCWQVMMHEGLIQGLTPP